MHLKIFSLILFLLSTTLAIFLEHREIRTFEGTIYSCEMKDSMVSIIFRIILCALMSIVAYFILTVATVPNTGKLVKTENIKITNKITKNMGQHLYGYYIQYKNEDGQIQEKEADNQEEYNNLKIDDKFQVKHIEGKREFFKDTVVWTITEELERGEN